MFKRIGRILDLDGVNKEFINIDKYFDTVTEDLQKKIEQLPTIDKRVRMQPVIFEDKTGFVIPKQSLKVYSLNDAIKDNDKYILTIPNTLNYNIELIFGCKSVDHFPIATIHDTAMVEQLRYGGLQIQYSYVDQNADISLKLINNSDIDMTIDYIFYRVWTR